jgi:NitT/TauT family transport system substrate-binding protein
MHYNFFEIEKLNTGSIIRFLIFLSIILILFLSFSISTSAQTDIRLSVSASPSSLPAFYIQQNIDDLKIETSIHRSRNVVISRLMKKEVDAALISTNEAAKLYNKGVKVQIAGIHTWGIFYLISSRKDIENWYDLKSKDIYVPDKGGPLDIVFQELLQKNNLDITKDLQIQRGKMREVTQLMINNMAETAVLREPFVTQCLLKNNNTKVVLDLQKEWNQVYSFRIPQSALIFRKEFAEENPELVNKLEENYKNALNYLNNNRNAAAELGQQFLEVDKEIILESYERLNLKYQNSIEVKDEIEKYFQSLMNYSKETIGGNIPDEEFYIKN